MNMEYPVTNEKAKTSEDYENCTEVTNPEMDVLVENITLKFVVKPEKSELCG